MGPWTGVKSDPDYVAGSCWEPGVPLGQPWAGDGRLPSNTCASVWLPRLGVAVWTDTKAFTGWLVLWWTLVLARL